MVVVARVVAVTHLAALSLCLDRVLQRVHHRLQPPHLRNTGHHCSPECPVPDANSDASTARFVRCEVMQCDGIETLPCLLARCQARRRRAQGREERQEQP